MFRTKHRSRRSEASGAVAGASTASPGQSRNLAARMGRWSARQARPLVEFDIRGDPDKAIDEIQPVVDRVAEAQAGAGTRTRSPGRSGRRRPSRGRDFDPDRPGRKRDERLLFCT